MAFVPITAAGRNPGRPQGLDDVDDVHLPRERPGEKPEVRERRSCLEGNGRLPILEEETLADEVRDAVEEPVDPLKAEVGHPDLVGVGEPERDPVRPEAIGLLGEALEAGQLSVSFRRSHGEPVIISPWSVVLGPWSLVRGLWSLVLVPGPPINDYGPRTKD